MIPAMTTAASAKLIRIGHSPDPDDAFMFYALAKEKIPMQGFNVKHVIEDIESLNERALQQGKHRKAQPLEVTAVSCHAYAYMADRYLVLRSGASVGDNYGPILVARDGARYPLTISKTKRDPSFVRGKKIAVPGKLTTAYLILQLFEADFTPVFIPFDKIIDAVRSGAADLGLLIHEGQITHAKSKLVRVLDLGQWWYEKTKLPLPLGIDVVRRDLPREQIESFARLFKASIEYAVKHRKEALQYALQYGRGISEKLGDRFVGMYVNDFTLDLGPRGEKGLRLLYKTALDKGLLPSAVPLEFAG